VKTAGARVKVLPANIPVRPRSPDRARRHILLSVSFSEEVAAMTPSRRTFLHSTLAAGAGLAIATRPAAAIEPVRRHGRSHLRLSMAAYSYRQYLALNQKPRPAMTFDDFIDTAADLNLDAVELTAYYFTETGADYLAHLKGKCSRLGLDVSGTAVGNNFCTADPAKLREQIASVKRWVEHTSRLGGKTIRIFAGNVDRGDTEASARARCIEATQEACEHAGKYGIILALENHGGITATIDQTLELVRAVKHPWFGVNWDTGNFHSPDPYADLTRLAPYAVTVQIKTEIVRTGRNRTEGESRRGRKEEADLKRLLEILRSVGYRGYVALEYEAEEDPRTGVPRAIGALRPLMG
jgi:sugar phosphate isomerase/epimerase